MDKKLKKFFNSLGFVIEFYFYLFYTMVGFSLFMFLTIFVSNRINIIENTRVFIVFFLFFIWIIFGIGDNFKELFKLGPKLEKILK